MPLSDFSERILCVIKHVGERSKVIDLPLDYDILCRAIGADKVGMETFWHDDRGKITVLFDDEYVQRIKPKNVKDPSIEFGFHAFYGSLLFVRTTQSGRLRSLTDDEARSVSARVDEFSL